jgi:enhancing lycopene biosynthesis protein 2
MSKNVLVILSGCGVYDGSEIHEAVISLLALAQAGATVTCAAPNKDQMHVINHANGEVMDESRNVMVEAARISRGNIQALSDIDEQEFDAVFLPGGFGAAKNLCTFAIEGPDCSIDDDVANVLNAFHRSGKPIGAVCISPAVVVKALGTVSVTIGSDPGTIDALTAMGASHVAHMVDECHIDEQNNVITAPAYMLDAPIDQIALGITAAVNAVIERA